MKNIGKELKEIIESKRLVKNKVAGDVGISSPYLSKILRENSDISCGLLEKICIAIKTDPAYFFDYRQEQILQITETKNTNEEIKHLKEMLAEKERTINILLNTKALNANGQPK